MVLATEGSVLRDFDLHIIKEKKSHEGMSQDSCGNDATRGFVCDLLELPSKVWIETRRCYETCVSSS